jgi:putative ABC transport system substrate-binding protein
MHEVDAALVAARVAGADALVLFPDPITLAGRERIAAFALQHKLPLVSGWDNYALAGGLVTYGPNLIEAWRRTAIYVDRILKGTKPSDLPIEQPTIFELVVNRKTATALGIDIPESILTQADRLIE